MSVNWPMGRFSELTVFQQVFQSRDVSLECIWTINLWKVSPRHICSARRPYILNLDTIAEDKIPVPVIFSAEHAVSRAINNKPDCRKKQIITNQFNPFGLIDQSKVKCIQGVYWTRLWSSEVSDSELRSCASGTSFSILTRWRFVTISRHPASTTKKRIADLDWSSLCISVARSRRCHIKQSLTLLLIGVCRCNTSPTSTSSRYWEDIATSETEKPSICSFYSRLSERSLILLWNKHQAISNNDGLLSIEFRGLRRGAFSRRPRESSSTEGKVCNPSPQPEEQRRYQPNQQRKEC